MRDDLSDVASIGSQGSSTTAVALSNDLTDTTADNTVVQITDLGMPGKGGTPASQLPSAASSASQLPSDSVSQLPSGSVSQLPSESVTQIPSVANSAPHLPSTHLKNSYPADKLRPAEIAYLSSNGDISHTMLVLAADLVQRALKAKLSVGGVPPLAPYEVRMWALAKNSVSDWAQGRLEKHIPTNIKKDPIEYIRRMSKIYNFVVHTARHFVVKLIQDPRQIRRYFKVSAIATLIADFSTAGYKAAFEDELRNNLRARGLIVSYSKKHSFAKHFSVTSVIATIILSAVIFAFVQPWPFAAGLVGMCFLSAVILRVALLLLHSIPYYSEIAEVIGHLKRQSWRLQALRAIIRLVTMLTYSIVFVGFLILSGIALAILTFGFHHSHIVFLGVYVFLTLAYILPVQIYLDGWRLKIEERPTSKGERLLAAVRQDLDSASPLDSFRDVLTTTEYVPKFSELLAIYGIETLLILV